MNRLYGAVLILALLIPAAWAAGPAGLPVAKKTLTIKHKAVNISIEYPQTGNRAIDATMLGYVKDAVAQFKEASSDHQPNENAYTLKTTYKVERNDGKLFAVVFTEFSDLGGAHPNSEFAAFNFLLPDGAQVFLPEIVDGFRGIRRVSTLATAALVKLLGTGPSTPSDRAWVDRGAGPLADNFKVFILLGDKLHIYFPAYQVASHAAGTQEVYLPLASLSDVIRPDWRAPAPSFDCRVASGAIEKTICADAALARLDRRVAEAEQTRLQIQTSTVEIQKLIQSQRNWIALRDKLCVEAAPSSCLTKLYRGRLAILKQPPG